MAFKIPKKDPPLNDPSAEPKHEVAQEFAVERFKYIQAQIHAVNENVYRILTIYQALATTIVGGALALFVGYRNWGIPVHIARTGVIGLMCLETIVALFAILLIFVGVLTWLDYRQEECDLTDEVVYPDSGHAPTSATSSAGTRRTSSSSSPPQRSSSGSTA